MEATFFSVKPSLTLALTSCSPALLPSASLRSIRLGFGHNLRPPGASIRSRRRFKRLGFFQTQSPQFVVRASMDSGLILVVVAITTFSAIAVAYFHHSYKKRKGSSDDIARASSPRRKVPDHGLEIGVSDFRVIQRHETVRLNEDLMENAEEIRNSSVVEERYQVQEPAAVWNFVDKSEVSDPRDIRHEFVKFCEGLVETSEDIPNSSAEEKHYRSLDPTVLNGFPLIKESESMCDDSLSSETCNTIIAKENGATELVLPSPVLADSAECDSFVFASRVPDPQIEQRTQKSELVPTVPQLAREIHPYIASSGLVNNAPAEVVEQGSLHLKPLELSENASCYSISKETAREDLHTFFGVDQHVGRSLTISMPDTESLSLLNSVPELTAAELVSQGSHQSTDNSNGEVPVTGGIRGGSSHKRKESRRERRPLGDEDGRNEVQPAHKTMPQLPVQNGVPANDKGHSSEKFSAYNRLLRNGRLTECIDMLEDMEAKGLLNMDKIHHASFFKYCKTVKGVKEAFRFAKLVPNPTLSTFNMLMSVCASSRDTKGALQVLQLVQDTGMKADCKLYTTLISTCAKSGKVDAMFEVFHKMVNSGVEPNVHTYGALIDGCARAGQVAKAFGAYGIMRSKNVKPDRVVFNALITACGKSGVVDRAFDVLAEMRAEPQPIDPDHITVGALMKACFNAGQVDRAKDVYKMMHEYNIKGTPEVYTIAVNCCSKTGDWELACSIYSDMKKKSVIPDEVFFSALIDVAGHAQMLDAAFEILQEAKTYRIHLGIISYSSLMGACSNAKNWQKALELYDNIKSIKLQPTISTMNALITALSDGDQLPKAMEIVSEMKTLGLLPNSITYSVLLIASERKDDLDVSLALLAQAKEAGIAPNLMMCRCITGMCLRRFEKACALGEPILSFSSGRPQIENKWTSLALMVYREMILGGTTPTAEVISQVLGCLQLPHDASLRKRLVENLGVRTNLSKRPNLSSFLDGFGEYDPRAFSLFEEAASIGILPCISFKQSPIVVDATKLHTHTAQVYLITVLKGLKHRLAAGAKLPSIDVVLPVQKTYISTPEGEKTINLAGRISQALGALLRRMGLPYQGNESYGKIRINGLTLRRWFQPKLTSPFSEQAGDFKSYEMQLQRGILDQQRNIRTRNLTLD